jgi:hypothetical protein
MDATGENMTDKQMPTREAFSRYWEDHRSAVWLPLLWYVGYLGGLATYAFIITRLELDVRLSIISLVLGAAYVILIPYLTARYHHKRFARFIRCAYCGDWFGRDSTEAFFGPNPKFKSIIETGRCPKCGKSVLID